MNLLAMFDATPGIAAHRAHADGKRYALPDYPVPDAVPLWVEDAIPAEHHGVRAKPTAPGTRRHDVMLAFAQAGRAMTVPDMVRTLDERGESGRRRVWALLIALEGTGHVRRTGGSVTSKTARLPLFEIVPQESER